MHWIFELIVKHRNVCSLLLTISLSLAMVSSSVRQQASAVRMLTITVFYPLQLSLNQINRIGNIFSENHRLRHEVALLRAKVSFLQEQASENERLRKLLGFSQDNTYDLLPVRVIARDPSPLYRSVVVNAGKRDGITLWMPFVGEQGVVGKAVQVMGRITLVQLLTDPSNRVSILDRRTRTVSILETDNGTDFFMRCRSHEDIEPGDTVVTSGLGGIYPGGLPVATVIRIEDHDPLFKKVSLKLSVDFDHLEELFVMRLAPQWSSFHSEFDSLEFDK